MVGKNGGTNAIYSKNGQREDSLTVILCLLAPIVGTVYNNVVLFLRMTYHRSN